MDESGCFFSVACKGFSSEGKKSQVWKKSKQRITVAFFVSVDGRKVGKSIVTWRSKKTSRFRLARFPNKLVEVCYFDDSKSWMQVEIMEEVLNTLNFQRRKERTNFILFLKSATVHLTSWIDMYNNIKIVSFQRMQRHVCSRLMLESSKVSKQSTKRSWCVTLLHI